MAEQLTLKDERERAEREAEQHKGSELGAFFQGYAYGLKIAESVSTDCPDCGFSKIIGPHLHVSRETSNGR